MKTFKCEFWVTAGSKTVPYSSFPYGGVKAHVIVEYESNEIDISLAAKKLKEFMGDRTFHIWYWWNK